MGDFTTSRFSNAGFPQLNTGGATAAAAKPTKAKTARTTKDQASLCQSLHVGILVNVIFLIYFHLSFVNQEVVQRLFQETKPKDEFTQWCENSLKGLQTNIDGKC